MRVQLKSKIHKALITRADSDYEGSIEIPKDLMEATGLWEREKVLVASITTGARLETYVQPGTAGSGDIVVNGGAAHLIGQGEEVTIMSFGLSKKPLKARIVVCRDKNVISKSQTLKMQRE